MQVTPSYNNHLKFKANNNNPNTYIGPNRTERPIGNGRNAAPAMISVVLPGVGQMMNGKVGEGIARMVGVYALAATAVSGISLGMLARLSKTVPEFADIPKVKNPAVAIGVGIAAGVGAFSLHINNIVESYRYKSEK